MKAPNSIERRAIGRRAPPTIVPRGTIRSPLSAVPLPQPFQHDLNPLGIQHAGGDQHSAIQLQVVRNGDALNRAAAKLQVHFPRLGVLRLCEQRVRQIDLQQLVVGPQPQPAAGATAVPLGKTWRITATMVEHPVGVSLPMSIFPVDQVLHAVLAPPKGT